MGWQQSAATVARSGLVIALAASATLQTGCLQLIADCSLVGCESGPTIVVGTVAPEHAAELDGAWVEVCKNGDCVGGPIGAPPNANPGSEIAYFSVTTGTPGLWARATLRLEPTGGVLVWVDYNGEYSRFADGDVFDARLVRWDGELLVGRSVIVPAYRTSMPNGPDCEPTCRQPVEIRDL
jgi:hypothetical protein